MMVVVVSPCCTYDAAVLTTRVAVQDCNPNAIATQVTIAVAMVATIL